MSVAENDAVSPAHDSEKKAVDKVRSKNPSSPRKQKNVVLPKEEVITEEIDDSDHERKTGRGTGKLFPSSAFQDALSIADVLHRVGAGKRMRRITVFDELQKSPDSGRSRQLVTNSSRYGLTIGGTRGEYLELTDVGRIATDPDVSPRDQLRARFDLAIGNVELFKYLYEKLVGGKLPAQSVLQDMLREKGVPQDQLAECVDTFIVNATTVGLLRTMAGAERIISIEHALDDLPSTKGNGQQTSTGTALKHQSDDLANKGSVDQWAQTCFYIAPIGNEGSEERKHSDLFLNHVIEPALAKSGLTIFRADQISKSGMINSQVIEYILRSRLVIADLSFHNPNVFYELSLRHTCGLPTVQVIRAGDRILFDLQQYRTIEIDNTSIYSLVPKLEIYRSQVATQVRAALENSDATDNPIRLYFPDLVVTIPPVRTLAAK